MLRELTTKELSQIESQGFVSARDGQQYVFHFTGNCPDTTAFITWAKRWGVERILPDGCKRNHLYNMDHIEQAIYVILAKREDRYGKN